MKKILIVLLLLKSTVAITQTVVEIQSNTTTYKFPYFTYKDNADIEEKINSFLQLKHLKHLPEQFKEDPFTKALNGTNKLEYNSWKQYTYNSKILCISIYGKVNQKPFEDIEYFDLRTGDFFDMDDLFKNDDKKGYEDALTKKVTQLIDDQLLPKNPTIVIRQDLLETSFSIKFLDIENEKIEIPYTTLEPYLSTYGKNLLLDTTGKITRRPDIANKLLRDREWTGKGTKYEQQLKFKILVLTINNKGETILHRWQEGKKNATRYTEAIIKNNTIKADDYSWDSLKNEKVKMMSSLELKKEVSNFWVGTLQTGSPVYSVLFKEY